MKKLRNKETDLFKPIFKVGTAVSEFHNELDSVLSLCRVVKFSDILML